MQLDLASMDRVTHRGYIIIAIFIDYRMRMCVEQQGLEDTCEGLSVKDLHICGPSLAGIQQQSSRLEV